MNRKLVYLTVFIFFFGLGVWAYASFMLPDTKSSDSEALETVTVEDEEKEYVVVAEVNKIEEKDEESVLKAGDDLILAKETFTPATNSDKPLVQKAVSLIREYRINEAMDVFVQADTQESDQITQYYLGILHAYLGERKEAEEFLNKAVMTNSHPKTTSYANRFIGAYNYYDTYQGAQAEFLDALISKELLASGEFEIAIDKLRFITSYNPAYIDAWVLLGSAYLIQGKYDQSTEALKEVLPTDRAEVYYWLGLAYYYQNNLDKSISGYAQALRKGYQPRYRVYEKIGDIYLDKSNYEKAVENYSLALAEEDAKSHIDLYIRPVWLYNDVLDDSEQALRLAQQALEFQPDNAMAYNLVGWSYLGLENFAEAKAYLKTAKELDPNLAAARLNLGRYFEAVGDTENALEYYAKARELDPDGAIGESANRRYLNLQTSDI